MILEIKKFADHCFNWLSVNEYMKLLFDSFSVHANLFQKVCAEWRFWNQSFAQGLARLHVTKRN